MFPLVSLQPEAKRRRTKLVGEDGETMNVDFWGEAAEASHEAADIVFIRSIKVRSYSLRDQYSGEEDTRHALTSVVSTRILSLGKGFNSTTAELHVQLCSCMEEEKRRQSELQHLREQRAARRAAEAAARQQEQERLERLRDKGELKCRACKKKIRDFWVTPDWGSREYHKACWLRLAD